MLLKYNSMTLIILGMPGEEDEIVNWPLFGKWNIVFESPFKKDRNLNLHWWRLSVGGNKLRRKNCSHVRVRHVLLPLFSCSCSLRWLFARVFVWLFVRFVSELVGCVCRISLVRVSRAERAFQDDIMNDGKVRRCSVPEHL